MQQECLRHKLCTLFYYYNNLIIRNITYSPNQVPLVNYEVVISWADQQHIGICEKHGNVCRLVGRALHYLSTSINTPCNPISPSCYQQFGLQMRGRGAVYDPVERAFGLHTRRRQVFLVFEDALKVTVLLRIPNGKIRLGFAGS